MEPGIYENVPIEQYHSDKTAIGNSGIKEVLDCPALYYGQNLDPARPQAERKESAAQLFGNMVHCILFEHRQFGARYRVGPDVANKNLKAWQDFKKDCEADGASAIDAQLYKTAQRIRQSALALPDLRQALEHPGGRGELSAYWKDKNTGVLCKCRPDWEMPVGDNAVVLFDGKTFATGNLDEFTRQVSRMGYEIQAAWYSNGYAATTGKQVLAFVFIVISDEWPHAINLVQLGERSLRSGELKYRRGLDTYADCLRSGVWPGYGSSIKLVEIPEYAMEVSE